MKRRSDYHYEGDYKVPRATAGYRGRGRGRGRIDSGHYHSSRPGGRLDYDSRASYDEAGNGWRNHGDADYAPSRPYRGIPKEPIICQEVPIKSALASGFIGTKGETVTRIRQQSRCRIHVRKSHKSNEHQVIEFRGTVGQVETGLELMKEVLTNLDPDYAVTIGEQVACQVDIHPDQVGVIIGKNGQQVKSIRHRTGAWVRVEDHEPGTESQAVVILGTKDQVLQAYAMVQDLVERKEKMKLEWSPEMAGKAYMDAIRVLGDQATATDVAELLATTAGGWKAQLILEAWLPGDSVATSLGLQAAAVTNGGRHVCVVPDEAAAAEYSTAVGPRTEVVVGEAAQAVGAVEGVDFAAVDWRREDAEEVLRAVLPGPRGAVMVCMEVGERGCAGARWRGRLHEGTRLVRTALLPIGRGIQVLHVGVGKGPSLADHSRWITHVDSDTGEEHVFRRSDHFTSP